MKIHDKEFVLSSGVRCGLKATTIDLLKHLPSVGGVEASRIQTALATKLEAVDDEFDVSPEEATVIRELINRAPHFPATIHVLMYDAFDPEP